MPGHPAPEPAPAVTLVGIGADGWDGLLPASRKALADADVILGGGRHLDLLPTEVAGERRPWPSPLLPGLDALLDTLDGRPVVALASGDPLHYGIGRALVERFGAARVRVLPALSSISLACARMGWPVEDVDVVTLVGRPESGLRLRLQDGRRLLVLSADEHTPSQVCRVLVDAGCPTSSVTLLGDLGAPGESRINGTAASFAATSPDLPQIVFPRLNVVAVSVRADLPDTLPGLVPGLPDELYDHDGQLTKRHVRALTLAALAPRPGQLLWDVGGGSGSVAVEWARAHPSCRAVTVEMNPERAQRITTNADRLGVAAQVEVRLGRAPSALAGLPTPDAVFIGGGLTVGRLDCDPLIEVCWRALAPGGVLVANAVTLESEVLLVAARGRWGGDLTRIEIAHAGPIGRFTGWAPTRPVTQWSVRKPRPGTHPAGGGRPIEEDQA